MQSYFQTFAKTRRTIIKLKEYKSFIAKSREKRRASGYTSVFEHENQLTKLKSANVDNVTFDRENTKKLPKVANERSQLLPFGFMQKINNHRKQPVANKSRANMSLISDDFQKMESKLAGLRTWENTPDHDQLMETGSENIFTVSSFNILAQNLLQSHLYLYDQHDRRALDWKYRLNRLQKEILSLNPQILCLQEVQESHLSDIKNALKPLNLSVLYKKRTGFKDDGCAILYNHKIFNHIEHHSVEYYQPQVQVK